MKLTKMILGALCTTATIACLPATAATNGAFMNVECTRLATDRLHIDCKANDGRLADALINYDVKTKDGVYLAAGYGSTVRIDETKLHAGEEYHIVVYALIDGNVESQIITRKASTD